MNTLLTTDFFFSYSVYTCIVFVDACVLQTQFLTGHDQEINKWAKYLCENMNVCSY